MSIEIGPYILLGQVAGADAPPPAAGGQPGGLFGGFGFFIPVMVIMVLWIFFSGRSQKRKDRERQRILDELKPRDKVVTIGGIQGRLVSTRGNKVVICVDEKNDVRMTMNKSAISRPLKEGDEEGEEESR